MLVLTSLKSSGLEYFWIQELQNFGANFVFWVSRLPIWLGVRIFWAGIVFNSMLFVSIFRPFSSVLPFTLFIASKFISNFLQIAHFDALPFNVWLRGVLRWIGVNSPSTVWETNYLVFAFSVLYSKYFSYVIYSQST